MTQRGWRRAAIAKLWPSSCRDFLRLCNSWRWQRERKLSQYLLFKSPPIVKRGFESLACLLPVLGVERLEPERARGQPREERRERWSEIDWGRRTARARSTLWSTAEPRRDHWGRVWQQMLRYLQFVWKSWWLWAEIPNCVVGIKGLSYKIVSWQIINHVYPVQLEILTSETTELRGDFRFLLTEEDTASSTSPIRLSSFNAVSVVKKKLQLFASPVAN